MTSGEQRLREVGRRPRSAGQRRLSSRMSHDRQAVLECAGDDLDHRDRVTCRPSAHGQVCDRVIFSRDGTDLMLDDRLMCWRFDASADLQARLQAACAALPTAVESDDGARSSSMRRRVAMR